MARMGLLTLAGLLFTLYFLHLSADFPNHAPWMDWAKYTDEGWYGDAAIRHFGLGHWYVRGDFNPAAALPVWPLLEAAVFRFTGVGIVPARALTVSVFGLTLLCSYVFLSRALPFARAADRGIRLAPAGAVLLLVANPFCFAFMRMAILEPLLVLLTLVALLVASTVAPFAPTRARRLLPPLLLGFLLPLMVLTKTTAIFLLPSIAWMFAARCGFQLRSLLRWGGLAAATGVTLWLLYFGLVVRPHFLEDYRYLFSANGYSGITLATAAEVIASTVRDGRWMGSALFPLALLAAAATLAWPRLRANAAAMSLLLWAVGYMCFLAYHDNLQPRYYLVVAVPLTLLLTLVLELAWTPARFADGHTSLSRGARIAAASVAVLLLAVAARDARMTLFYVRQPEYTFLSAAHRIQAIIDSDRTHSKLLLSISGSDLTLMTGLPSICDDFGTLELQDRVALYKPGWYVSWNQVDDDKMDALTPRYHLERIAAFPALDDPDRNLLILYRLDPSAGYHPPVRRRRLPLPRSLISQLGQQPSESQLQH